MKMRDRIRIGKYTRGWLWNAELTAAETAGCRVEIISYTLVSGQPPKAAGMHSRT